MRNKVYGLICEAGENIQLETVPSLKLDPEAKGEKVWNLIEPAANVEEAC